jgi:hypothetical protein
VWDGEDTVGVSNMEIRFIPQNHSERLSSEGLMALPVSLLDEMLEEFHEYDESIKLKELNYGPGADWIWIYATIAGITQLIILGDKINSGFEGWEKLAKKILNLKKQCSHIALDKDAITSLCIYKILKLRPDTKEIEKVVEFEREVPVGHGTLEKGTTSNFIEKAQICYIQGFEIDSREFILIGSNIEGELEVLKHIQISKHMTQ